MRAYRFRLYPSKSQEKSLCRHLYLKKELWNSLLQKTKEKYGAEKRFPTLDEMAQLA